jgi:hypothetical protein
LAEEAIVTDQVLSAIGSLGHAWALISLQTSNGFAASVVCAFLAVGLLAIVAKFATTKPRNRRRPRQ